MTDGGRRPLARISEDPVVRVAAYYVLLAAATALLWQVFPGVASVFSAERLDAINPPDPQADPLLEALGASGPTMAPPVALAVTTALCMLGAFFLMLPVSWVYILTRQKKGFRQSVVQTLIILPIVVAGVVLLVKNSIALAFSLGGIVAAVSFRNTLRDTKDAVYIFLAIGVGLAAGVQVMSAAAVMSFLFNVIVLVFWYTDFGRAPANLEGPRAARRLERSLALANRTNAFVAQLDREILKSMSPEQLQALASRARRRVGEAGGGIQADGPKPPKPPKPLNTMVRVQSPDPEEARPQIEAVLGAQVKEWKFNGTQRDAAGTAVLEYRVRLRKSVPAQILTNELRARLGPRATAVETR
ncbi:MAG TPA: DUF4956 domain-containing protein [Gemmatimonadales bacterium]|nr:DUF4956 domain-containing protein [Gemmatimonadales bacterium]